MKRKDAGRVVARLLADVDNGYYTYLPVEAYHYRLARDWVGECQMKTNIVLVMLHRGDKSAEGNL